MPEVKTVSGKTRGQMGALLKQNGNGRGLELRRKYAFHVKHSDVSAEEIAEDIARVPSQRRMSFPAQHQMVEEILNSMFGALPADKATCPLCGKKLKVVDPGPQASPYFPKHKMRNATGWSARERKECSGSHTGVNRARLTA